MLIFYGVRNYGKTDASARLDICAACGKTGRLETYTTARFFHLYWIPLIPVGHAKIIDACPHCKQCRTLSPKKYRKALDENIASALHQLNKTPDDPTRVIQALNTTAAYNDQTSFNQLTELYATRMADNTAVQLTIAKGQHHFGSTPDALATCDRCIATGAGDDAKELKNKIEVMAAASETLKQPTPFPLFLPYLVPALILLSILFSFAQRMTTSTYARKIWLVNGSHVPYSLQIDDQNYQLAPNDVQSITLAQGEHTAHIQNTAIPLAPFTFEYTTPLSRRLSDNKVLVLNPDRLAFLTRERIPYTTSSAPSVPDPTYKHHAPQQWHVLSDINYPFRDAPDSIDMPSYSSIEYRTTLAHYPFDTYSETYYTMGDPDNIEELCAFAEHALSIHPTSDEAIWMLNVITGTNDVQSTALLNKGLACNPPLIEWHRFYQTAMQLQHPDHDLETEYRELASANPDQPAYKYLLGRILEDDDEADRLYLESEGPDGTTGYGFNAIAYDRLCRGLFSEALSFSKKATDLNPENTQFQSIFSDSQLAEHRIEPLIESINQSRLLQPASGPLTALQIRYLSWLNRDDEADQIETECLNSMDAENRPIWSAYFTAMRHYAHGDTAPYLDALQQADPENWAYENALHTGNIQTVLDDLATTESSDYTAYLIAYCAAKHHHNDSQAQAALDAATALLQNNPAVRQLLLSPQQATPEKLTAESILPDEKKLIACTLAHLCPENRQAYFNIAETFNFSPFFPQHLIHTWAQTD